jgi:glycosyltransferase involved in cell wall biosynthesis
MITAVIITHNEERNIARCLESLVGIADEVLVLDGFSSDRTVEICQQHNAVVIQKEWMGYAATKNFANDMVHTTYILSLDADEMISPALRASLLGAKAKLDGAYSFNRQAFYCGKAIKHCGWYPDEKLRLFPKGKAKWEGDYVHEVLKLEPGVPVHRLQGDLLHYTYYSVAEHRERARKYAGLASEKLRKKGKGGLFLKAIFSPGWRFFQMYFMRGGILEGWRGWRISWLTAREVWWKYWWALTGRRLKQPLTQVP